VATTPTRVLTFEEFQEIPNPPGGRYELHHGELVAVGFPEIPHVRAQWQLRRLLEKAAGDAGVVHTEVPFRPLPEHECWGADVAYMSRARWDSIHRWLFGVPDLVIEVLSPSNTAAEMLEKEQICLENDAQESWVVNTTRRVIKVSTREGRSTTYKSGEEIPLFFRDGERLKVDDVFA